MKQQSSRTDVTGYFARWSTTPNGASCWLSGRYTVEDTGIQRAVDSVGAEHSRLRPRAVTEIAAAPLRRKLTSAFSVARGLGVLWRRSVGQLLRPSRRA